MKKLLTGTCFFLLFSSSFLYGEDSMQGAWACVWETIPGIVKVEITPTTITKRTRNGQAKTLSIINQTEGITAAKMGHAVGKAIYIDYFHFDTNAKKFYQIGGVVYANRKEPSFLPGLTELVASCEPDF